MFFADLLPVAINRRSNSVYACVYVVVLGQHILQSLCSYALRLVLASYASWLI